ncbi:MAG: SPOR domain-containing protein [Candidatus Moraniibacteriota bacterium]
MGKKQAKIQEETQLASKPSEQITQEKPIPPEEKSDSISQELASHEKAQEEKIPEEKIEAQPVKTKAEPPKQAPATQPQNHFWIQVGAFSSQQNANAMAEEYKSKGYDAVVLAPSPTDRTKLYRVRLGGYPSREEAERARDNLAQQEKKQKTDYLIIR